MTFWKYQGAGNDFIMVDQRAQQWLTREHTREIERLCDRRFGIGADGLILLQHLPGYDFEMIYFNADGRESTMCGNGGRCIAAFARHLDIIGTQGQFMAIDGEHEVRLGGFPENARLHHESDIHNGFWVELKMIDVPQIKQENNTFVLNTGSPHYVRFENDIQTLDMVQEGRAVRYSEAFKTAGINVNLVSINTDGSLDIRTYERGVEDETLACGTGVTAAALASALWYTDRKAPATIQVHARGGDLAVRFNELPGGGFGDIWLCGPAVRVFEGRV